MIQRIVHSDDVAREVGELIGDALRPWRVVLFGSRARGNAGADSDYDLYVEVHTSAGTVKEQDDAIRTLLSGRGWFVDLKVRPQGEIERRRDDPGTIEWDVAREGRVLYADPAASRDLAPKRVREPDREPPESVHEWVRAAERDMRHAGVHTDDAEEYAPEICWLSHQAVEKYMKALLVSRRVRPGRTHDLVALLAALRATGDALPGLDDDCESLTKHAIAPRYPSGLNLSVKDATAAFAAAQRVIAAVRSVHSSRSSGE